MARARSGFFDKLYKLRRGTFWESPYNKDYSFFGLYIGSPYLWKLPYRFVFERVSKHLPSHFQHHCLLVTAQAHLPEFEQGSTKLLLRT